MGAVTEANNRGPTLLNNYFLLSPRKREVMELCQIACEKFAAAEKTPYERDNQAAATMIKVKSRNSVNIPRFFGLFYPI